MKRHLLIPGLRLLLAAAGLLILGQLNVVERINWVFYDQLIQLNKAPVNPAIVIVAIDEKSIHDLGRWPWTRDYHRQLVEILDESGARSVAFDLIFTETESPQNDSAFASAVRASDKTFFSVAPEPSQNIGLTEATLPLAEIAVAAKGFGHVDYIADIDGVCRKTHLYAGYNKVGWPVLPLAVLQGTELQAAGMPAAGSPATGSPAAGPSAANLYSEKALTYWKKRSSDTSSADTSASGWYRSFPVLIPYYGPTGSFNQLSYVDVLKNRVAPEVLRNKLVLVGATAVGIGDNCATPYSHTGQNMSGVEINANLMSALMDNRLIFTPDRTTQLAWMLGLGLCFVLLLAWLISKKSSVKIIQCFFISAVLLLVAATLVSFLVFNLWWPPVGLGIFMLSILVFWQIRLTSLSLQKAGQLEISLFRQKRHDQVTDLPNRQYIVEKIASEIAEPSAKNSPFALFIIRLGGFKSVNDHFGMQMGDEVLKSVASVIHRVIEEANALARISGAEYAVLLSYSDITHITHAGAKLSQILQQPVVAAGRQFQLYPSVGVCLYPQDGATAEALMDNAHTAMRRARADKTRDLCFYSQKLKQDILHRSALEQDLVAALQQGQFELYYQPQVATETNSITGVEALIRWHHPTKGLIPPNDFIPIAESTGFIIHLGEWVLRSACVQGRLWLDQGVTGVRLAVNISPVQFSEANIVDMVIRILEETHFPAHMLELELTENILIEDVDFIQKTLKQLKSLGVQLAVDDFGTGYSSLSYLQRFHFDRIKIDQSFVRDIETNSNTAEIIWAIIEMAHRLKLGVIAEGIETEQQQLCLAAQSCEEIQGFYFSKPLTAHNLTPILISKNSHNTSAGNDGQPGSLPAVEDESLRT